MGSAANELKHVIIIFIDSWLIYINIAVQQNIAKFFNGISIGKTLETK